MQRISAEAVMILLGVTSGALLVLYALTAAGSTPVTDSVFWTFVAFFLGYIVWDVRRHLRVMASRSVSSEPRRP